MVLVGVTRPIRFEGARLGWAGSRGGRVGSAGRNNSMRTPTVGHPVLVCPMRMAMRMAMRMGTSMEGRIVLAVVPSVGWRLFVVCLQGRPTKPRRGSGERRRCQRCRILRRGGGGGSI